MKSGSRLEEILESGQFAVTAEAGPPKGSRPDAMRKKGELLKSSCDAINVTDNQAAVVRMSSLAGCLLLMQTGAEPVLQMVVRDRNRLALQSDILGAAALGIRNVLCLAGDHQRVGNHPTAAGAYDVDPIQLIQMMKTLRDEHRVESGETISGEVPLYIGTVAHPFAEPLQLHMITLAKKIRAGADFIQTQAIFEMPRFIAWMDKVQGTRAAREGAHPGQRAAHQVGRNGTTNARGSGDASSRRVSPTDRAGRGCESGGRQNLRRDDRAAQTHAGGARDSHHGGGRGRRRSRHREASWPFAAAGAAKTRFKRSERPGR